MLAALHGLNPGPLDAILGPADWAAFLAGQRATATERQRQVKLPDPWLSQIEGFLESAPLTPGQQRVLLHSEVIREHPMVDPGTWRLSGLLDFERAMTGDRAYEFAAAGLFVSRGDPRLLGRILAAYARSFDPRELLAYSTGLLTAGDPFPCSRRIRGSARSPRSAAAAPCRPRGRVR